MPRYKCVICQEFFKMDSKAMSQRSISNAGAFKKVCLSDDCMAKAVLKKYQEIKDKNWKKRKEKLRKEVGAKKPQHQDKLQVQINKIVRILDKDLPCLARPEQPTNGAKEAGHIFSVGSHPTLRYHLWVIHGQSNYSNCQMGGEQGLMLEGIERRYGLERRQYVESLRQIEPIKLSAKDKREKIKLAGEIIKELDSGIKLTRDEINKRLNIYKT